MREPGRDGGERRPRSDRRRVAPLVARIVALTLLAGVVAGLGVGREGDDTALDSGARLQREVPTTVGNTTTTAPTTTTTEFTEPVPVPVEPPADPYAEEPHIVLGTIEIPKIGLSSSLNQGISLRSIDRGPSHWPGTALPGQAGNAVIAGHRVTKTRPFRHIDQLVPGDEVIFTVGGVRWRYHVTGSEVVTPTGFHILEQTAHATATLFACHPPGSARYRYVVHLEIGDMEYASGNPAS